MREDVSTYLDIKGIDYKKFKLFLLSILWRAGISNLPIFRKVTLGKHQEILRERILTNDPGSPDEYLCAIFTYLHKNKLPHQIVAEPGVTDDGEPRIYAFLISGNLFVFFTKTNEKTEWVKQCTINENGEMKIVQMSENLSVKTINKFIGMDFL